MGDLRISERKKCFRSTEVISFLPKSIAGSIELGKALAFSHLKIFWFLCCEANKMPVLDTFLEKAVDCSYGNRRCLIDFSILLFAQVDTIRKWDQLGN